MGDKDKRMNKGYKCRVGRNNGGNQNPCIEYRENGGQEKRGGKK